MRQGHGSFPAALHAHGPGVVGCRTCSAMPGVFEHGVCNLTHMQRQCDPPRLWMDRHVCAKGYRVERALCRTGHGGKVSRSGQTAWASGRASLWEFRPAS